MNLCLSATIENIEIFDLFFIDEFDIQALALEPGVR